MDTKQTGKIKAIEHKDYKCINLFIHLVGLVQKEKVGWEEIEELKSARNTSCNVVDALQYVREEFGSNDYEL